MTVACKTIDLYNVPSGKTITNDIEAEHKKRDWKGEQTCCGHKTSALAALNMQEDVYIGWGNALYAR